VKRGQGLLGGSFRRANQYSHPERISMIPEHTPTANQIQYQVSPAAWRVTPQSLMPVAAAHNTTAVKRLVRSGCGSLGNIVVPFCPAQRVHFTPREQFR
jgi:hypothetical protein